jgi:biotin carboxyl carrier protein
MALEQVRSETAGSIWKIVVAVDDLVQPGDVIMLLELMKMEIPIVATCAGRIAEIAVTESMAISANQLVATIERSDPQ